MGKISIIIVNHNHGDLLKKTIHSIYKCSDYNNYDLIIVDNNHDDLTIDWIKKEFSNLIIISNSRPRGFASNVNHAIKFSNDSKYILMVNPDVEIKSGLFNTLLDYMDNNNNVGIAAPLLLNPDFTLQYSCRRFSTILTTLMRGFHLDKVFVNSPSVTKYLMKDTDHSKTIDVDWVTGALMIVRKKAINDIGLLDNNRFYLYAEDQDWCIRMWLKNWRVSYVPNAKAVHHYLRKGINKPFSISAYYQLVSTVKLFKKYNWNLSR